ncbi:MAG: hypothetical protein WCF57_12385 [Pyrinomonadaceae bacterium]
MKRCPACNESYTDDSLKFCLNDGAPLLSVAEARATDPYPPPRDSSPPQTEIYRPGPPSGSAYSTTPNAPQKSSALPWIIGGIVALLVLAIGVVFVAGIIISMSKARTSDNSNNANYAAYNRNRRDNSNSSTSSAEQQSTPAPTKALDVSGIWNGSSDGTPATLVIRRSEDNSYEGVETAGEFKDEMLVKVEVSPATRRIIIKEVRKLKGDNWNLGVNEGTISSDGRSMSGTAKDAKGKAYSWSFTRK